MFNECLKYMLECQEQLKSTLVRQLIHSGYQKSMVSQLKGQCIASNKIAVFNIIYLSLASESNLVFSSYMEEGLLEAMKDNLRSINSKIQHSVVDILYQVVDLSTDPRFLREMESHFLQALLQMLNQCPEEEQ